MSRRNGKGGDANSGPTTLADLKPLRRNARRRTERSSGMLERSLREFGAARSIVIDEDGTILAGHGTVEAAAAAGIERVTTVEADGNEVVAVVRRGLSQRAKQRLALADNRTAELAEWDVDILAELADEDGMLEGLWGDRELAIGGDDPSGIDDGREPGCGGDAGELTACPKCGFEWSA